MQHRITSLDIMRGVIMLLMAIDHVRVYSGVPAGGPSPSIFFTRWVTHFCAPGFVFLAGTGAFLHGRKLVDKGALARYLLIRGLILVVLELTVIRFSWTLNFDYAKFALAGVIWMLGWCMVLLAALVRLSPKAIGIIGLAIIFFQQAFRFLPRTAISEFFYPTGFEGDSHMAILYVLVPWIGVMAAGYGFGAIMIRDAAERDRLCLRIGLAATAIFLVVGGFLAFNPPGPQPVWVRLLNQNKYPASPLYLLMTLGPMIALLPLAERARGGVAKVLATFGRVPMFYYLVHIPVIHAAAHVVTYLREGALHHERYMTAPFAQVPAEHRWTLPLLYLVVVIVITILYFPCRWFAEVKSRRRDGWLRYI